MSNTWRHTAELIQQKRFWEAKGELQDLKTQGSTVYGLDDRLEVVEKPIARATDLIRRAEQAESAKHYREALKHLKAARSSVADMPGVQDKIKSLQERLVKARESLDSALEAYEKGLLSEAKTAVSQSLSIDPDSHSAQRLLSAISAEVKDKRRASALIWSFACFAIIAIGTVGVLLYTNRSMPAVEDSSSADPEVNPVSKTADSDTDDDRPEPDPDSPVDPAGDADDSGADTRTPPKPADPEPEPEPEPELATEPAWVAVSGEKFMLRSQPPQPHLPGKTDTKAIPSEGGLEMPMPKDDVTLTYQGLPDGVTFEKLEKGETPRFVIKDSTREIAEIHLKTNPPAGEKLMLSATALVGDKELIQILGGTSLAFQSAGVTRIFYIEDTVQQLEVDPIPFPPASTGEEKVETLSLSARQQVMAISIDGGKSAFTADEEPLSASISHEGEGGLAIRFVPQEQFRAESQGLELRMASSLSKAFAAYTEVLRALEQRRQVLQIFREYKPVYEQFKNAMENALNQNDPRRTRSIADAALKEMRAAEAKIDAKMQAAGSSVRGQRDFMSLGRATSGKPSHIQTSIDVLDRHIRSREAQIQEAEDELKEHRNTYNTALVALKPSRSGHEIELLSGLGVPVAKFKLEFDIRELPARKPE